jgi:hypothetical protein
MTRNGREDRKVCVLAGKGKTRFAPWVTGPANLGIPHSSRPQMPHLTLHQANQTVKRENPPALFKIVSQGKGQQIVLKEYMILSKRD